MQRISQAFAAAIPPSAAASDTSSIRTHLNSPTDSVFPRDASGYPAGAAATGSASSGGNAHAGSSGISQTHSHHHGQRGSISAQSQQSAPSGYASNNPSGIILRERDPTTGPGNPQRRDRSSSPATAAGGTYQAHSRWHNGAGGVGGSEGIWDDPRRTRFSYTASGDFGGSADHHPGESSRPGMGGHRPLGKTQSALEPGSSGSLTPGLPAVAGGPYNRRPGLLRQVSDNAIITPTGDSRSRSPSPAMRNIIATREAAAAAARERSRDRTVRVSLSAAPSGGMSSTGSSSGNANKRIKLSAMVAGPKDGQYALGGGQHLRVVQIKQGNSGGSTPIPEEERRPKSNQHHHHHHGGGALLGKGQGGVRVEEVVNLWKGNWAVSKGVIDLDWGVGAFENKIVSATPSGNFMLFDVNRGKLEKDVSTGQARPLNCVRFCKAAPGSHGSVLLTGGTEGQAKIWDLRDRDPVQRKYFKHSTPITSLCFSPSETHSFVVGLENGSIRRYDLRQGIRAVGAVYGAHGTKPVLDLKWKAASVPGSASTSDTSSTSSSSSGGWLASAGVDSVVQIWDMSQSWDKPVPVHTLHTSCPVRKVAWRPGHETDIAVVRLGQPFKSFAPDPADPSTQQQQQQLSTSASSTASSRLTASTGSQTSLRALPCFVDSDSSLEVWDVRRHYVAKYSILAPDNLPVDVAWGEDDRSLVSCFQGGTFAQLDIKDSVVPLDAVPRQAVTWSIKGEMAFACDRFQPGEVPFDDLKPEYAGNSDKIGKRPKAVSDPRYDPLQATGVLPLDDIDADEFTYLALQYRLTGDTPANLCQWNSEVASVCGRDEDARLWGFLRLLIEEFEPDQQPHITDAARAFDEGIFTHLTTQSTEQTARLPSPPSMSPRGSSVQLPGADSSRSAFGTQTPLFVAQGLPLEPAGADQARDLETLASLGENSLPPGGGRSTPGFRAFVPPDARRVSEAHSLASASTIVPDRKEGSRDNKYRQDLSASVVFERSAPGASRDGGQGAGAGHSQSNSQSSQSSRHHNKAAASSSSSSSASSTNKPASSLMMTAASSKSLYDWPDPYGIIMEGATSTSNSTIHSTTGSAVNSGRTSPVSRRQNHGGLAKADAKQGARPDWPEQQATSRLGVNGPQESRQRNSNEHIKAGGTTQPVTAEQSRRTSRDRDFDPASWKAYRASRCRPFLTWWASYVDDGEVQLAASLFVVGRGTVRFPQGQSERLCHAYIEMLYRHRMPIPAASLRLAVQIPSLEIYAQDIGVTHIAHCQRCRKATGSLEDIGDPTKRFWACKRCRLAARVCAICRLGVKGLWMGCGKCHHGGHQHCMRSYYLHSEITTPKGPHQIASGAPALAAATSSIQRTQSAEAVAARQGSRSRRNSHSQPPGDGSLGPDQPVQQSSTGMDPPESSASSIGYNPCPTGCGCRCRAMLINSAVTSA